MEQQTPLDSQVVRRGWKHSPAEPWLIRRGSTRISAANDVEAVVGLAVNKAAIPMSSAELNKRSLLEVLGKVKIVKISKSGTHVWNMLCKSNP